VALCLCWGQVIESGSGHWIPFGGGARMCLGLPLAMAEAKVCACLSCHPGWLCVWWCTQATFWGTRVGAAGSIGPGLYVGDDSRFGGVGLRPPACAYWGRANEVHATVGLEA
jgi:hypothetical protein